MLSLQIKLFALILVVVAATRADDIVELNASTSDYPPLSWLSPDECRESEVKFRVKPYCVTAGCEKRATVTRCINYELKQVLASDGDECPAGTERGSQVFICFDEQSFAQSLCAPSDRPHTLAQFSPYCVPDDYEENGFATLLLGVTPLCDGQPCPTLGRLRRRCPAGMTEGKRKYRCSFDADVDICLVGQTKSQVRPYCYPDDAKFEYSPFCGVGDCVFASNVTGDCPEAMLTGPIRTVCSEKKCSTDAIVAVQPYCEPIGQTSYLVGENGIAFCDRGKAPCAAPDSMTGECPVGSTRGAMQSVCNPRFAEPPPAIQPYCEPDDEPSYLVADGGVAICGFNNKPCPIPDPVTNECPPNTKRGERQDVFQPDLVDVPFAIRLIVRQYCSSHPSSYYTHDSDDSSPAFCSNPRKCALLHSPWDECPPGMFRGHSDLQLVADPNAAECPLGYSGKPPNCVAPRPGYAPGIDLNSIDPNALKSLIG